MKRKDDIIRLRSEGKTYKEIKAILNCSLGTIAYHCGDGQKSKYASTKTRFKTKYPFAKKAFSFRCAVRNFKRDEPSIGHARNFDTPYGIKDVTKKFEDNPVCYLTGRKINLEDTYSYQLDHIVPRSKGGSNDLTNMGLSCREANQAKHDMSVDELLSLCKDILINNGYVVEQSSRLSVDGDAPVL